ncbi:hypothetical protein EVAR_10966_1 [Eumeta japonica]|uniref:Uncharacterized protein n=1 Tax=Eumeta variegata TaxID=151549 RepID=A0A4C1U6R8_EUMVA|nr:hypothetical protein EVAR_10966_1 [Eumeta japonica]
MIEAYTVWPIQGAVEAVQDLGGASGCRVARKDGRASASGAANAVTTDATTSRPSAIVYRGEKDLFFGREWLFFGSVFRRTALAAYRVGIGYLMEGNRYKVSGVMENGPPELSLTERNATVEAAISRPCFVIVLRGKRVRCQCVPQTPNSGGVTSVFIGLSGSNGLSDGGEWADGVFKRAIRYTVLTI